MHVPGRQDRSEEGATDRCGVHPRGPTQVAVRVVVQRVEQRGEVVRGQVGMEDQRRPCRHRTGHGLPQWRRAWVPSSCGPAMPHSRREQRPPRRPEPPRPPVPAATTSGRSPYCLGRRGAGCRTQPPPSTSRVGTPSMDMVKASPVVVQRPSPQRDSPQRCRCGESTRPLTPDTGRHRPPATTFEAKSVRSSGSGRPPGVQPGPDLAVPTVAAEAPDQVLVCYDLQGRATIRTLPRDRAHLLAGSHFAGAARSHLHHSTATGRRSVQPST